MRTTEKYGAGIVLVDVAGPQPLGQYRARARARGEVGGEGGLRCTSHLASFQPLVLLFLLLHLLLEFLHLLLEQVVEVVLLTWSGEVLALLCDGDEANAHFVGGGFSPSRTTLGGLLGLRGLAAELSK